MNQELDNLVPGGCDTGIPRHLISRIINPAIGLPFGTSGHIETLSNHFEQLFAFNFGNKSLWSNLGNKYFSFSTMSIPANFKLVTDAIKVTQQVTLNDIDEFSKNSKPIDSKKVFMRFIHSINDSPAIVHPCSENKSKQKKMAHVGMKVCVYPIFTAMSDSVNLDPMHLIFYVENPPGGTIANKLLEFYTNFNLNVPLNRRPNAWYLDSHSVSDWESVFAIPLMTPNSGVIFNIIPAKSVAGKNYLLNWINNIKVDTWIGIDVVKEAIEAWETDITIDARVK